MGAWQLSLKGRENVYDMEAPFHNDTRHQLKKPVPEKRWLATLLAGERASGPLLKFFEGHGSW